MKKNYDTLSKKLSMLTLIVALCCGSYLTAQNLEYEWAYNIGAVAQAQDRAADITTDLAGNVYTIGSYLGTFDFDPGPGVENRSSSFFDAFVSKLDANGDFVWATNFGGTNSDAPSAIFVDAAENVYITGTFYNSGDFDFGAGTTVLTSNGFIDVYVIKISAAGNFEWAKSFGGTGFDYGSDISVDQSGNVYVTGVFSSTVDFDPGPGTQTATANSSNNHYILKLDASGNFDWANTYPGFFSFGGSQFIVNDSNGDIYVAGGFSSTVDMDPGTGVSNITSNGGDDIFISKLDASGNFIWAKNVGGSSSERPRSFEIDNTGNLYLAGKFSGTADFDPGAGTSNTISNGDDDIFVAKYDANGDYIWAKGMGGLDDDEALALSIDTDGNVFTTGSFLGTADFDPGTGVSNLTSSGFQDVFISKLDVNGDFAWVKSIGGDGSENGNGISADIFGSLYITGDFNDTLDFDPGVGVSDLISNGSTDIYVLKLSCQTTFGTETVNACDSYVFNGVTYTTDNNTATDTLLNANGCDSILTLNLTISSTTSGLDTRTECSSYIWVDGITYTASNSSTTFTLVNAAGCDSILQLDLTIVNVNVSTTLSGNTITSNAAGATYQWIDCDNGNTPLAGETNAMFTATVDGNYAVLVTEGNCIDTSDCVNVILTGIGNKDSKLANDIFSLYPNPAKDILVIETKEEIKNMVITDIAGKTIKSIDASQLTIDVSALTSGIYFLEIEVDQGFASRKFIKR